MPIDPNVLKMLAEPPMLKLDDPLDQMGKAATNAFNMERAMDSRRTRQRTDTLDNVMRENTDARGNVNHNAARYGMAQAGVGSDINAYDEARGKVDHLTAQTNNQDALALKAKFEARDKLFGMTGKMLTGVSRDPKVGPLQMMDVLESTYPDLVSVMGEDRAERLMNQRVEMLAQSVDENKWPVYLDNEQLGIQGALKRNQEEAELAHKKVLEAGRNSRQAKQSATQADLLAKRQVAEKARQDERIAAQARLRRQQDEANALRQNRAFSQQDRIQANQFDHQDTTQSRTIKTQKELQAERIAAQNDQALAAAERARIKAETDIARKRNEQQAIGASIVAREINAKFPEFIPQGVMGKEGDAGWIKLNMMPPNRGGPDKLELQMFKKYLASKGMAFIQGGLGQPSWAVPAGRLDAQTLRKQDKPTSATKLVTGADGTLVEAKPGVKVKAPALKRPDFDARAAKMYKQFYDEDGYAGSSESKSLELQRIRDHVAAQWEHDNNGGPKPPPFTVVSKAQDVLRLHNAFLEYRKKQSQIERNDRSGVR